MIEINVRTTQHTITLRTTRERRILIFFMQLSTSQRCLFFPSPFGHSPLAYQIYRSSVKLSKQSAYLPLLPSFLPSLCKNPSTSERAAATAKNNESSSNFTGPGLEKAANAHFTFCICAKYFFATRSRSYASEQRWDAVMLPIDDPNSIELYALY